MTNRTDFIIKALHVVSWIIFIGFCIQTGTLVFNYIFSLINPAATHNLYLGLNLSELYRDNKTTYTLLFSCIAFLSAMKAYLFYLIIMLLSRLDLLKPFSLSTAELISKVSYQILNIGVVGLITHQFAKRLAQKGINVQSAEIFWNDSDTYLLLAAVAFVFAQIFRKGIELQNENDLTV